MNFFKLLVSALVFITILFISHQSASLAYAGCQCLCNDSGSCDAINGPSVYRHGSPDGKTCGGCWGGSCVGECGGGGTPPAPTPPPSSSVLLPAPTGLDVSCSGNQATFTWNAVPGAGSYLLRFNKQGNNWKDAIHGDAGKTVTGISFTWSVTSCIVEKDGSGNDVNACFSPNATYNWWSVQPFKPGEQYPSANPHGGGASFTCAQAARLQCFIATEDLSQRNGILSCGQDGAVAYTSHPTTISPFVLSSGDAAKTVFVRFLKLTQGETLTSCSDPAKCLDRQYPITLSIPACTVFAPEGLTRDEDKNVNGVGIPVYRTIDATGSTSKHLTITRTPLTASINSPTSTPALTFFHTQGNNNDWSVSNIPSNTSTSAPAEYTVTTAITFAGQTHPCPSFIIRVPAASTPTPAPPVCRSFTLPGAGFTPGPDNASGGKTYTVSSTGATSPISVTRVPADASVAFTPTTGVTPFADGTGWSLTIPPNTSTTPSSYTLAALVGGQASCNPITLTVNVPTLPACTYSSTQILFRKRRQDTWSATGTVNANQPIFIAAFHNGNSNTLPADTALSITDPEFQSVTIPAGNNVAFTPTKVGTYVISATTPNYSGGNCVGSLPLQVDPATVYTQSFKIAESPTDLAAALWQPYTGNPMALTHTLSSPLKNNDVRTIFIQFQSSEGINSRVFSKRITYTPDPRITNLNCHQVATGTGTAITIKGVNFGPRGNGKIKIGGNEVEVGSWNDQTDTIDLTLDQRLEGRIPVTVIVDDGRSITANCSIGTTFLEFETRTQCKLPGQSAASNVEVKVFEIVPGILNPEPLQRQKISFDKDGKPQGFAPKFEKGKNYALVMKGSGMLARKVEFKAEAGTTILDPISLPVGDIAPANSPDGRINAFDKSELIRQWSIVTDVARSGDFNGDSRINSIDYACMRQNFNQSDESYTPPAVIPRPSPAVLPSSSPADSSSPSPTPSPSASPTSSGLAI